MPRRTRILETNGGLSKVQLGSIDWTAFATRWIAGDGCPVGGSELPGVTPRLRQEAHGASLPSLPSGGARRTT